MSNLAQRILFAVVAIPVAVGIVWLGGWVLAGALAVLGALGAHEVFGLPRRQGVAPLAPAGLGAAAAIPVVAHWARGSAVVGGGSINVSGDVNINARSESAAGADAFGVSIAGGLGMGVSIGCDGQSHCSRSSRGRLDHVDRR